MRSAVVAAVFAVVVAGVAVMFHSGSAVSEK
jgi:hypothetical protein